MQGLNNLGATCSINSLLQVLYRNDKIKEVILNSETPEGTITYELKDLFKVLESSSNSVNPGRFIHNFYEIFKNNFRKFEQNDICELYLFIIQKIHDETAISLSYNSNFSNIFEEHAYKIAKHNDFKKSNILDLIQGSYLHSVQCLSCGDVNRTFEPYIYIDLDVNEESSIRDLLLHRFTNEVRCKDSWVCDKCKLNSAYIKKTTVWKFPDVLFISLNRFQQNNIPITTTPRLNLQKEYSLNSIGLHYGNLENGHYVSMCLNKNNSKFYMYDDNIVNEISSEIIEKLLKSTNSYLISYV